LIDEYLFFLSVFEPLPNKRRERKAKEEAAREERRKKGASEGH